MATLQDILSGQAAIDGNKETLKSLASTVRQTAAQLDNIEGKLKAVYLKALQSEDFSADIDAMKPELYALRSSIVTDLGSGVGAVEAAAPGVVSVIDTVLDGYEPPAVEGGE